MTIVRGALIRNTPYVLATIRHGGILVIEVVPPHKSALSFSVAVDTGFSGSFSLPLKVLNRLSLDLLGSEPYVLADGSLRTVPVYMGKTMIGKTLYDARFIPGQPLMSVEFMKSVFSSLNVSFSTGNVTLS